jgi:hypothetical protein
MIQRSPHHESGRREETDEAAMAMAVVQEPDDLRGGNRTRRWQRKNYEWGEGEKAGKSLKNMEPMSGLEPLTYALRMETKAKRKVIDVVVVAEKLATWLRFGLSIQFPFVSPEPNTPDL